MFANYCSSWIGRSTYNVGNKVMMLKANFKLSVYSNSSNIQDTSEVSANTNNRRTLEGIGKYTIFNQNLYNYCLKNWVNENPILAQLRQKTLETVGTTQFQISPDQGQFLQLILKLMNVKNILELGTHTGYSTLAMALGLYKLHSYYLIQLYHLMAE